MSLSLTQVVRRSLANPDEPVVKVPVLLWEAPPSASQDEDWALTEAGFRTRPAVRDPIVLLIEKVSGRANPFAMGITVGRVETNDIIVDDASVSRFHAWLQHDPKSAKWLLCDAESKNGTYLGAQRLKPNQKVELTNGISLRFGEANMTFYLPDGFQRELKKRSTE